MVARACARTPPLWTCPVCGRRFAKSKQAHSCRLHSLDQHFRGKDPKLRSIFESLCRALERTGPLRLDAVESTINLISRHHFGGIAVRRDYLRVGFIADHEIRDSRISRHERVGSRRVSHHVLVRSTQDLDAQLLRWLAEAQAMQARPAKQRAG